MLSALRTVGASRLGLDTHSLGVKNVKNFRFFFFPFFFSPDQTLADPGGSDDAFSFEKQTVLRNMAGWARAGFKDDTLSCLCWKK